jgi:hypothetical protein
LFFPLLLLEAAQLHIASAKAIARGRGRANAVEALLLLVHVAGYLTALLLVLSPVKAAAFVLVQQGLFGLYLGCAFAPNHISYTEATLFGSYSEALRHLHSVGAPSAQHRPPTSGASSNLGPVVGCGGVVGRGQLLR